MPRYNEKTNELVFSSEESTENFCPVCGAEPDYDCYEVTAGEIKYPWNCGKCGASGAEYSKLVFNEHWVAGDTLPPDLRAEYTEIKTHCINGSLSVGDIVLSTIDGGWPCLPGKVIAIDLLGSQNHDTGNLTDDVHVDFTGDYGDRRKQEILEAYVGLSGTLLPFEDISLEDVIMGPDCLIKLTGIKEEALNHIAESEENAVRYAYQAVRSMIFVSQK